MKHLKYIKEYFDSEEIKQRISNDKLDIEKLVSDDSILDNSTEDAIVSSIKYDIPYLEDYFATEYESGIMFKQEYNYNMSNGESLLAMLLMYVEPNDVPEELKGDGKFEDKIYQVRYNSIIYWIQGEENTTQY